MKPFVIYTANVGNYDTPRQPLAISEQFDYILFSNQEETTQEGIWQVKPIPYTHPDPTRVARWVKTHPEELLSDYQASVWMDCRIRIVSPDFYQRILQLYAADCPIASLVHPERDCAYDELLEVMQLQLEEEDVCLRWGQLLTQNDYPSHHGLSETGILYRKHTAEIVQKFDTDWWQSIADYSRRDQLSFDYTLWKLHLHHEAVCQENVRECPWFDVASHSMHTKREVASSAHSSLLTFALRYPYKQQEIARAYQSVYRKRHPKAWANAYGLGLLALQQLRTIKKRLLS